MSESSSNFVERCRENGRSRVKALAKIKSAKDREEHWQAAAFSFPFKWGSCWKSTIELKIADFEAELGFFIDVLGFHTNAVMEDYAMFTGPDRDFFFSIARCKDGEPPVPVAAISLDFMIAEIEETCATLRERGICFEQELSAEWGAENAMRTAILRSPSGYRIKLWGMLAQEQ